MASSLIDVCRFNPTAGGTTDWTYSTAVTGYQSPAAAAAINGATYSYRAESADLTQWEIGTGVYSSGTGVLTRVAVLFNSSGTTSKINFSAVPQVAIVALAEDILSRANNLSDLSSASTAIRNLGGLDLSTTVAVTTTTTLTTSAFGKLHLISGTSSYTVTLPTPVGNTGAIIALSVDNSTNATKLYTISSPSGNIGRATSLIMWAYEQLVIRSDGTNWIIVSAKQLPFVGTLNRTTNLSLTSSYAEVPMNAAASNDPTALNLAYDSVNFRFVAPRTASWILTPYSYQTQSGSPTSNQAAIGDSSNAVMAGTLMASSLTAGVISAPQTVRIAAGTQARLIARADGTSPVVAAATLPAHLDYQEIVPSW